MNTFRRMVGLAIEAIKVEWRLRRGVDVPVDIVEDARVKMGTFEPSKTPIVHKQPKKRTRRRAA